MAFATKKCAQSWAEHYLKKSQHQKNHFVDPFSGADVQPVKLAGAWCFGLGFRDDWLNDMNNSH